MRLTKALQDLTRPGEGLQDGVRADGALYTFRKPYQASQNLRRFDGTSQRLLASISTLQALTKPHKAAQGSIISNALKVVELMNNKIDDRGGIGTLQQYRHCVPSSP